MNTLLIDTSTNHCSIASEINNNILTKVKYKPRKHNEYILDMIDAIISESKITKYDIDLLAYGIGPGSFTGIRLSAALMYGISFVIKKPVIGFSSMHALAKNLYTNIKSSLITLVLNARIGYVYLGQYQYNYSNHLLEIITEECITIKKLQKYLKNNITGLIAGDLIKELNLSPVKIIDYFPDTQYMFEAVKKNYKILKERRKVIKNASPIYFEGTQHWEKN